MDGAKRNQIIATLYDCYKANGFITENEALSLFSQHRIPLHQIDSITAHLLTLGVIIQDDDEVEELYVDRSKIDYDKFFDEVIEAEPELWHFIEYVRGITPPQPREWRKLLPQAQNGNEYAKNRMIEMYLRVVINIAWRFHKEEGIELDDAIQEGSIGLIRAIKQFDVGVHGVIGSYIPLWIQQYISRAVADKGRVVRMPVHVVESLKKIQKNKQLLEMRIGREPTLLELAQISNMPVKVVENLLLASQEILSLNSFFENDGGFELVDMNNDISEIIVERILQVEVRKCLKMLTLREREVICLRFGIATNKIYTLEEIGCKYGITRERVRQIETKALRKLRNSSYSTHLKLFL